MTHNPARLHRALVDASDDANLTSFERASLDGAAHVLAYRPDLARRWVELIRWELDGPDEPEPEPDREEAAEGRHEIAQANQAIGAAVTVDQLPHSRACGIALHPHGPSCSRDCPTCHGKACPCDGTGPCRCTNPACSCNDPRWTPAGEPCGRADR